MWRMRSSGPLLRWILAAARLARSFWEVDRVRAPPGEGRLLRIRPPSILMVEGRAAEVLARSVGDGASGPYVLYRCRSASGPCQLRVAPVGPGWRPRLRWMENGVERELSEGEVEVFARNGRKAREKA